MTNLQRAFMEIARSMSLVTEGSGPLPVPSSDINERWRNLEATVERMCTEIVDKALEGSLQGVEERLLKPWDNRLQSMEQVLADLDKRLKAGQLKMHASNSVVTVKEELPSCQTKPVVKDHLGAELRAAVAEKNVQDIQALLKAGADINSCDAAGRTPLYLAVAHNADLVALLLSKRASVRCAAKDGTTPLHRAVVASPRAVALLIGAGANVAAADRSGTTPLHLAGAKGRKTAAKALLAAGADPTARNRRRETPADVARNKVLRKILSR